MVRGLIKVGKWKFKEFLVGVEDEVSGGNVVKKCKV